MLETDNVAAKQETWFVELIILDNISDCFETMYYFYCYGLKKTLSRIYIAIKKRMRIFHDFFSSDSDELPVILWDGILAICKIWSSFIFLSEQIGV